MLHTVLQEVQHHVCESQMNWRRNFVEGEKTMPFVTLTYAQSIDGSLTMERDNPSLNARLVEGMLKALLACMASCVLNDVCLAQAVVHNQLSWTRTCAVLPKASFSRCQHVRSRSFFLSATRRIQVGLWWCVNCVVMTVNEPYAEAIHRKEALEALGARVYDCAATVGSDGHSHVDLRDAFRVIRKNGIDSIMVEGGSAILTSCLQEAAQRPLIDLVVVTIAPTFVRCALQAFSLSIC
ncbi:hypothetical protein PsorP6_005385 [Peronosclerospora sorghi]|uniref:Uncharacterized protein n=1 Tax=Peronosclerospora sorghi TaxID=230839 RepID=A0ACC0W3Z8_9STRA|nr:hypothetical protein PsorP6_005385 [Peronosclerospora sorghi]